MTTPTSAIVFSLLAALHPGGPETRADAPSFTASMPEGRFEVGETYELVVRTDAEGAINPRFPWDPSFQNEGLRRPILLLDVPGCVRLLGAPPDPLVTPEDFQRSFLRYPYGRRIRRKVERIRFELTARPAAGDTLGLNLVAYTGTMGSDDPEDATFLRRRIDLPVRPGARASTDGRQATRSDWGRSGTLQVGDHLPDATLSSPEGDTVGLDDAVGDRNALILVYRRET